jgi:hypothetical protein
MNVNLFTFRFTAFKCAAVLLALFCGGCQLLGGNSVKHTSIKRPIRIPVSLLSAVECYPCREVPLNYNRSLPFHGGDTGSTPVRDAKS